jgi:hypothetical protein
MLHHFNQRRGGMTKGGMDSLLDLQQLVSRMPQKLVTIVSHVQE